MRESSLSMILYAGMHVKIQNFAVFIHYLCERSQGFM